MTNNTLYVVATPIGNLDDLSLRAADVLKSVDIVAAEDTRHTKRLLDHIGTSKPMIAIHDHNERSKIDHILSLLQEGKSIALVSDAGTPLISDPGYPLVNACREQNYSVSPIPGPCAIITALSAAGLPTDRFAFEGFLPAKSKGRQDRLKAMMHDTRTWVFYESTHRILACLSDIKSIMPDRHLVIARELTKRFETFLSGQAHSLLSQMQEDPNQVKGEFVVMIQGAPSQVETELTPNDLSILSTLMAHLPLKGASSVASEITGKPKKQFYQAGLELKE